MPYITINAFFMESGSFGDVYYLHLNENSPELVLKKSKNNEKALQSLDNENNFKNLKNKNILVPEKYSFGDIQIKILNKNNVKILVTDYLLFKFAIYGDLFDFMSNFEYSFEIDNIFYQVSNGLKYLEERRIVHCDLKLENILVFENYNYKICDFGLSIKLYKKLPKKFTGSTSGIHGLEVLKDNLVYINSDVFSFGILMIDLLLKRTLFSNINPNVFFKIITNEMFPYNILKDINRKYHNIIKKCLVLHANNRITSLKINKYIKRVCYNRNRCFCSCF